MRKRARRSQKIKSFLIFGIALTLILILIVSALGNKKFSLPHKIAMEIVGTVQYAVSQVTYGFKSLWSDYIALIDVNEENRRLTEKVKKLQAINNSYREAAAVNARLKKLLDIKESLPPSTLTAQIIGKDPSQWFKTVIVNRGSNDAIQKGMPVVSGEGIVGQVLNTSPHYSKILLAIDPNSAVDGLIQSTRVQGLIKGKGETYDLQYVLKNYEVQKDDYVVTSGLGGVFPKGIAIGKVITAEKSKRGMFQKIEIEPAVDFTRLEYVVILLTKNPFVD